MAFFISINNDIEPFKNLYICSLLINFTKFNNLIKIKEKQWV